MDTVYIETSVVSHLRQRPSSQVVMAAHQLQTLKWWNDERTNYELVVSPFAPPRNSWAMIQKPKTDSVIAEIHRTRREISERFNGDIDAIAEDAARRLAESGRPVWQPKTTNRAMHQSDEVERSGDG